MLQHVGQASLIPGDVVTIPFSLRLDVTTPFPPPPVSFTESATVELFFVPEPSRSSVLAPGAALLALMGRHRGQ